jgi:hypothetical protein
MEVEPQIGEAIESEGANELIELARSWKTSPAASACTPVAC